MAPRRRRARRKAKKDDAPKRRRRPLRKTGFKTRRRGTKGRGRAFLSRNPLYGPPKVQGMPFDIYAKHTAPAADPQQLTLQQMFPTPASWTTGEVIPNFSGTLIPAQKLPENWLAIAAATPQPIHYLKALGMNGTQLRQALMQVRVVASHRRQLLKMQQQQSLLNMYNSGMIGGAPAAAAVSGNAPKGVATASFFGDLWHGITDVVAPVAEIASHLL